ncbi:MAG TPA: (deoxy)nucleoside triphosphate pyrophosphohydrolase [Kofleriaceae bacterium]|nr:(deoxy)nucleoside triphosphate pyrophosphohydrolase [Kofleriaceae bacterium]
MSTDVSSPRPRKLVVAGLVVDERGRVLVTRRRADQPMGGFWELPGGKLEPGEAPIAALVRELREELGAAVEVGAIWDVLHHAYPAFDLLMLVYRCRLVAGEVARAVEVADLDWCEPAALLAHDVLPADAPLCARLAAEGAPPWLPPTS